MKITLACSVLLLLILCVKCAADTPKFTGTFSGEKFKIELQSQDGTNYTGVILVGDQKYPVVARPTDKGLTGEFQANGNKYAFEATQADGGMTLITGGATHALKKIVINPLGIDGGIGTAAGGNPAQGADAAKTETPNNSGTKPGAKDPLAYQVLQLPGGTAAKFDNWQYGQISSAQNMVWCDGFPQGRSQDFVMRTVVSTPSAQELANLFTVGPQLAQQVLAQLFGPVFKSKGEAKKCTCGGDDAMIEEYEGSVRGTAYTCRVMYVKRKDVAVAVLAIGTEAGFKEFGRAIEIVAQSISFKESVIEKELIGTWVLENYMSAGSTGDKIETKINVAQSRSITIYPNGTFSDTAQSGFSGRDMTGLAKGSNRGTVVKRGNALTFHYDDGSTWTADYELYSNGLKIDGKVYLK